jgi:hypothetical protein
MGEVSKVSSTTVRRHDETGLKLSYDRKVTPASYYQELRDRWVPIVPNSFGLPSGSSCPGKTEFCRSCYAAKLEPQKGVREKLEHNFRLLKAAGSVASMAALIDEMLGNYDVLFDRAVERRGEILQKDLAKAPDEEKESIKTRLMTPADRLFRIHWNGDFFNEEYAEAWYIGMSQHPDKKFFTYTHSFPSQEQSAVNVVPVFMDAQPRLSNFVLYLSVDEFNVDGARATAHNYPEVLLAGCAEDYFSGRNLLSDMGRARTPRICPENAERIPLSSAIGRGACADCGICPDGRSDILFSTSHKEWVPVQPRLPGIAVDFPARRPAEEISF